jgi:hypothetical protein
MSTQLPTTTPAQAIVLPSGIDLPIGIPPGKRLPTSFRVNAEIQAHSRSVRVGPRSRGFHPSELPRTCGQKFVIYDQAIENFSHHDPRVIQEAMRVVRLILDTEHDVSPGGRPAHLEPDFEEGSAIHRYQQFRYGERGYLWGTWECPNCRARTAPGFMPRVEAHNKQGKLIHVAAPCPACKGRNYLHEHGQVRWVYIEPFLGLAEWTQGGHTDGIWLRREETHYVPAIFEVKSINENGYLGKYGEPLPKKEHIAQASQYVFAARQHFPWLAELRHIYFVYVNKNAPRDTKEFMVEADMQVVAKLQGVMSGVLATRRGQAPPTPLRICQGVDSVGARACPVVFECFGQRPPASLFDPKTMFKPEDLPL